MSAMWERIYDGLYWLVDRKNFRYRPLLWLLGFALGKVMDDLWEQARERGLLDKEDAM